MDKLGPLGIGASLTLLEGGDKPSAPSAAAGSGQTAGGGLFAGFLQTEIRTLEKPGIQAPAPLSAGDDPLAAAVAEDAGAVFPVPAAIGSALAPATSSNPDGGAESAAGPEATTPDPAAVGTAAMGEAEAQAGSRMPKQPGSPVAGDQAAKTPDAPKEGSEVVAEGDEGGAPVKAADVATAAPSTDQAGSMARTAKPLQVLDVLDARARQLIRAQQEGQDGVRAYLRPAGYVPGRPGHIEIPTITGHPVDQVSAQASGPLTAGAAALDPAGGVQIPDAPKGQVGQAPAAAGPISAPVQEQAARAQAAASSVRVGLEAGNEGTPRSPSGGEVPVARSGATALDPEAAQVKAGSPDTYSRMEALQGAVKTTAESAVDGSRASRPDPKPAPVDDASIPAPGEENPTAGKTAEADLLRVEPEAANTGAVAGEPPAPATDRMRPSEHIQAAQTAMPAGNDPAAAAGGKVTPVGESATAQGALRSSVLQQVLEKADPTLNTQKVTIELRPENLGKVEIEFRGENDRLEVRIQASTPAAAQALSENLRELTESIKDRAARYQSVDIRVEVKESTEPRPTDQNRDQDRREQSRDQGRQDSQDRDQRKENQEGRRQRRGEEPRARWQQALREEY
ncbi:flagellar hook-length control protein FliK [bacterium]|nr:flagellar hook-length control protein FliK [bacterium]